MLSLNFPSLLHNYLRYRSTFRVVAQLFDVDAQLSVVVAQLFALSLNFLRYRSTFCVVAQLFALSPNFLCSRTTSTAIAQLPSFPPPSPMLLVFCIRRKPSFFQSIKKASSSLDASFSKIF